MLKVSQVAKLLNLSNSKVYELVEQGHLAHHRMGGAIRVSEEQLAQFLDETKQERGKPKSRPRPGVRTFKHLDAESLRAAWRKQGGRALQQGGDSARSSA